MSTQNIVEAGGMSIEIRRGYLGQTIVAEIIFTPEQIFCEPRSTLDAAVSRLFDELDRKKEEIKTAVGL